MLTITCQGAAIAQPFEEFDGRQSLLNIATQLKKDRGLIAQGKIVLGNTGNEGSTEFRLILDLFANDPIRALLAGMMICLRGEEVCPLKVITKPLIERSFVQVSPLGEDLIERRRRQQALQRQLDGMVLSPETSVTLASLIEDDKVKTEAELEIQRLDLEFDRVGMTASWLVTRLLASREGAALACLCSLSDAVMELEKNGLPPSAEERRAYLHQMLEYALAQYSVERPKPRAQQYEPLYRALLGFLAHRGLHGFLLALREGTIAELSVAWPAAVAALEIVNELAKILGTLGGNSAAQINTDISATAIPITSLGDVDLRIANKMLRLAGPKVWVRRMLELAGTEFGPRSSGPLPPDDILAFAFNVYRRTFNTDAAYWRVNGKLIQSFADLPSVLIIALGTQADAERGDYYTVECYGIAIAKIEALLQFDHALPANAVRKYPRSLRPVGTRTHRAVWNSLYRNAVGTIVKRIDAILNELWLAGTESLLPTSLSKFTLDGRAAKLIYLASVLLVEYQAHKDFAMLQSDPVPPDEKFIGIVALKQKLDELKKQFKKPVPGTRDIRLSDVRIKLAN